MLIMGNVCNTSLIDGDKNNRKNKKMIYFLNFNYSYDQ